MSNFESLTYGEDALAYESSLSCSTSHLSEGKQSNNFSIAKKFSKYFTIFNPRTWFQLETKPKIIDNLIVEDDLSKVIEEILKAFRENDIHKMEKFLKYEQEEEEEEEEEITEESVKKEGDFIFLDQFLFDDIFFEISERAPSPGRTFTVLKSGDRQKSVRFQIDSTPNDIPKRPFTPLVTSTPRYEKEDEEVEEVKHQSSENWNQTSQEISTIQYRNESIMSILNKSRQDALKLAFNVDKAKQSYRIYYDDTDEEEVEEIDDVSLKIDNLSIIDEQDISIDSSVHTEKMLENQIDLSRCSSKESSEERSKAAMLEIVSIEEKIMKLSNAINNLKRKFDDNESSEFVSKPFSFTNSYGDSSNNFFQNTEAIEADEAFESSCWHLEKSDFFGSAELSSSLVSMNNLV